MRAYLVLGIYGMFIMSLGLLLVYFLFPEKDPRKEKRALSRIDAMMSDEEIFIEESTTPEPQEREPVWRNEDTRTFYRRFVSPYRHILKETGHLSKIEYVMRLLDLYGHCPSVVNLDSDTEYDQLENVFDVLSRVSLREHSFNVAKKMIEGLTKKRVRDPELLSGKILITALGHDLGKIPGLLENKYRKGDHAYISYLVMKRVILADEGFPQRDEILRAIKEHHFKVDDGFTGELRRADHEARESELERFSSWEMLNRSEDTKEKKNNQTQKVPTKPPGKVPLSWLKLRDFLARIEENINVVDEHDRFQAFSMNNGLVYVMLDLVSSTVFSMAKEARKTDLLLYETTKEKKRMVEYTIKTMLDEKGYIPSFIGEGYSGARFALVDSKGKRIGIGIYMPIISQAFQTSLAELEARKKKNAGVLSEIAEVRPLIGKKKDTR